MSNAVFPTLPGITWSKPKTPEFKTRVQQSINGREVRAALRQYPLYNFTLTYEFLRAGVGFTELQTLLGFFLQRQGNFDSFLYTDLDDSSVTDQVFGTGDGTTTKFQLIRTFGGFPEPVMNVNVLTNIKKATVIQTNPANYTIDSAGMVTFSTAPTAGQSLTWTGTYYYRVRFLEEALEFNQFMSNLWENKKLELIGSLSNKI